MAKKFIAVKLHGQGEKRNRTKVRWDFTQRRKGKAKGISRKGAKGSCKLLVASAGACDFPLRS